MVDIRSPFVVNIDVTSRCNLNCTYCYAPQREPVDISAEKCIALIDELVDVHGVFHLTLAGGEPLYHPDILRILSETYVRHGERIALLSNGTRLLDDDFFASFSKICFDLDRRGKRLDMQISLDSHLANVHDQQRDQGLKVIAAVERALNLPITLQLACVVTKNNVHCADKIIENYYPRVTNFHYMNVMPSAGGTGGVNYWNLLPAREEIEAFHQRIEEAEQRYQPVRITKIVRDKGKEGGSLCAVGCLAGTTRIDIAPDLRVFACCMSDEMLGNLAEQTFGQMWLSAQAEKVRADGIPYCFKWAV